MSESSQPPIDANAAPGASELEIERVFLLGQLPPIPSNAVAVRIEQGYFPESTDTAIGAADIHAAPTEGRVRRAIEPDGSIVCTHTIKHGGGLVRHEIERTITLQQFDQVWAHTAGRRFKKTRYRVATAGRVWEIDEFDDLNIVLAEVELPSIGARITIPEWLAPHIVREVTDDTAYRNYHLALRLGLDQ